MSYVDRDTNGNIISTYANAQYPGHEYAEDAVLYVPPPAPLDQIKSIEAANPITHRNLRDLSMTVAQIAAAVTGTDPMVNPAVQQIVALEAQIAALRAQIP